ncbi:MAG: ABC-type transport system permease component LolE [Parcubacteria group bacterium GW2011_GWB1_43_8]|nr:MAG: ABC-type transport system permease component LolE [Parcubacteria group bacterium GW2011_GWB1_43_8]
MFFALNLRIGFFLAVRQIKRASLWTTGLIVFVMVLTFLNLVVVSGVLVGIVQGSIDSHRTQDTGDVIVSSLDDKKYIENSPEVIGIIKSLPKVKDASARYRLGGTLEANYKTRKETDKPNIAVTQIIGIDPVAENNVTNISKNIIKGEYLSPDDYDQIVLGSLLLNEDFSFNALFATLKNVSPGVKIRVNANGVQREVTVKGVFESKVQDISRNAYMIDSQFRSIIGRNDGNVSEIAIKLNQGVDPKEVSEALILSGVDEVAKIKTYYEAQPQFLKDVIKTFAMLGNMLSSIGLVVASITIFIVIFINAITRRKFIGILKGIGINGKAIEASYVFQSIFYALCGSAVGLVLVYAVLVPFFIAHPIDFPFSDGILVAPVNQTIFRIGLLVLSTVIAGYIPARMIVRKNTLDSILGRN